MVLGNIATRERWIEVYRHEAGHLVMARLMGFKALGLVFPKGEAGANIDTTEHLPTIPKVDSWVRRRLMVLYAGVCAELLAKGTVDVSMPALQKIFDDTGADDARKIGDLLLFLRSLHYPVAGTDQRQKELHHIAGKIIADCKLQVEALADEIVQLGDAMFQFCKGHLPFSEQQMDALPFMARVQPLTYTVIPFLPVST